MTSPVLTLERGELRSVIAMLGSKPAGFIAPIPGARGERFYFVLRVFDEPRSGRPASSLPAAKTAFIAKLTDVLRDSGLVAPGQQLVVDDRTEGC